MKKKIIAVGIAVLILGGNNLNKSIVAAKEPEEVFKGKNHAAEELLNNIEEADTADEAAEQKMPDIGGEEKDDSDSEGEEAMPDGEEKEMQDTAVETVVPIYNYEIDNVIVPTTYAMSLNPYEMPIIIKKDIVSTEQVVSRNYGIVNKSSTDKIVTVTFTVEDLNKDKIVFVDSAEEAQNADEESYAVYLSVIPAGEGKIQIGGMDADTDTGSPDLSDVEMSEAKEHAVALHAGENRIAFRLSKAVYDFEEAASISGGKPEGSAEEVLDLVSLNPDGKSATAFTFGGAMNSKADWGKLLKGVKITAAYDYQTADGTEEVIGGTGALTAVD